MTVGLISHAKGEWETPQQKFKKRAGRDGHLIQKVAIAPYQEEISYAKGRGYLQKVSKFGNSNPRAKGWGNLRMVSRSGW